MRLGKYALELHFRKFKMFQLHLSYCGPEYEDFLKNHHCLVMMLGKYEIVLDFFEPLKGLDFSNDSLYDDNKENYNGSDDIKKD